MKCNICNEELNDREEEIHRELSEDNIPCLCHIAKRIHELEKKIKNADWS